MGSRGIFWSLDGVDVAAMPLLERKEWLAAILKNPPAGIAFNEHEGGDGEAFRKAACRHGLEGIVSKRTDRRYLPGDRGVWVKASASIAPSSSSSGPGLGALLLGYYEADGRPHFHHGLGTLLVGVGLVALVFAWFRSRLGRHSWRREALLSSI
jgi:ATP-dependent DNA ligase